jgi:hypothetical protein
MFKPFRLGWIRLVFVIHVQALQAWVFIGADNTNPKGIQYE